VLHGNYVSLPCIVDGGTRVPVPNILDWEYCTPTFQDEKVKNLLSSAVNRSDLLRLNYNKTVFWPGLRNGSCWKSSRCSSRPPHRTGTGYLLPIPLLVSRPKGALFSFLFLNQLRPCYLYRFHPVSVLIISRNLAQRSTADDLDNTKQK